MQSTGYTGLQSSRFRVRVRGFGFAGFRFQSCRFRVFSLLCFWLWAVEIRLGVGDFRISVCRVLGLCFSGVRVFAGRVWGLLRIYGAVWGLGLSPSAKLLVPTRRSFLRAFR